MSQTGTVTILFIPYHYLKFLSYSGKLTTTTTIQYIINFFQESYIRRKRGYEEEILHLTNELEKAQKTRSSEMDTVEQISNLRDIHKGVLENINHVKSRTGKILQGK